MEDVLVLDVDGIAEPFKAAFAEDEFEAGLVLIVAVTVLAEDADDGLDAVHNAIFRQEIVEDFGFVR